MSVIFFDHNVGIPKGTMPLEVMEWANENEITCRVGAMYASFKDHEDAILFTMVFGKRQQRFETISIGT